MKRLAAALIICLLPAVLANAAIAETAFPTRPVRMIVPFPGGGINDVLARIVGDRLQATWGQPIVIENKTGAGGNIGAAAAYQSDPDGYTLMVSPPGPLAINQTLYRQLSYKPQEFVPLTMVGSVPNAVIVRNDLPVNSLKELVAYVKANAGKVSFGSQGNGATLDAIKLPEVQARIRAVNVEPGGNSPADTAAFINEEARRWGEVIRKNNIVVD